MAYNYVTLTSAIQQYAENSGPDFVKMLPSIVENAVRAVARETDVVGLHAITTVTTSIGSPTVTLPDECLLIHTVAKVSGATKQLLKRRPYDYIVDYWPDYSSVGSPLFYDRVNDTTLYVGPTPSSETPIEIMYTTVSIPSSTKRDSYILTRYPELVLYRCMVETNLIMKDMQDAQTWQQVYDRAREAAENEARRNRRDDTATPIMGKMGANTLKGNN
jgi:hypothetical protein